MARDRLLPTEVRTYLEAARCWLRERKEVAEDQDRSGKGPNDLTRQVVSFCHPEGSVVIPRRRRLDDLHRAEPGADQHHPLGEPDLRDEAFAAAHELADNLTAISSYLAAALMLCDRELPSRPILEKAMGRMELTAKLMAKHRLILTALIQKGERSGSIAALDGGAGEYGNAGKG
jgi:hypothetical protein